MKSVQDGYKLHNGVSIPCVGFGTWLMDKAITREKVGFALETGYRHIDTAFYYKNERGVGEAVRESGIPREEIFVTSKLWNDDQGYDNCKSAFEKTMNQLQLDYLDLYLIHWPIAYAYRDKWQKTLQETWRAFEELYQEERIKAIGVSNCKPHHLEVLMETAKIMPMVNQIEIHPGASQEETVAFCKKNNILVEAWGPLAKGTVADSQTLEKLAEKYGKTEAQVSLRWELQRGLLPLPKSVTEARIIENTKIFDFKLTPEDMKKIDEIQDCVGAKQDPDQIEF